MDSLSLQIKCAPLQWVVPEKMSFKTLINPGTKINPRIYLIIKVEFLTF